jgi:hypothetical protein
MSAEPSLAAVGALLPHSSAAMRLRLSNPDLVPELLQFLESRIDVVTKQVSDNEVELSLLGSYNEDAAQRPSTCSCAHGRPAAMTKRASNSSTEQMT